MRFGLYTMLAAVPLSFAGLYFVPSWGPDRHAWALIAAMAVVGATVEVWTAEKLP